MSISSEREQFLKKIKKSKRIVLINRLLIIAVFLVGWEILAKMGIINTFLSSCPSEVIQTTLSLLKDGSLPHHIGITLYEVLVSFSVATLVGIFIATILWGNQTLAKIIDPYLTILNSLPKVALGPLIIIWVGASINSIIFMALLISTFITIINIYNGFISTDKDYIILLKSLKASKTKIFFKVVLPSNLVTIINALKINISMSLIGS